MSETGLAQARKAAASAEVLALVAVVVIVTTLAANYGAQSLDTLRDMPETATLLDQINMILRVWILVLPPLLFVGALWEFRKALQDYAKGEFFSPRSAKAVRRAGEQAIYALAAQMLIVPTIQAWIDDHGGPPVLRAELTDWALLAFVVGVAAIGRVLDLAVAIKADNDSIV
jgi:hypothetical protein